MEVLNAPLYNEAFAARLSELTKGRVHRWLRGYDYTYSAGRDGQLRKGHMAPIVARPATLAESYASFLDLIDLLFVKRFLDYGISLQKIRKALAEAERLVGGHHFAQRTFFTDGRNIFLQVKDDAEALMELLTNGQWVIAPLIKELAHQIEFDRPSGLAHRWYPLGPRGMVVLDPLVSFGNPTIVGKGVSTAVVYDNYLAEKQRVKKVAHWMNLDAKEVAAAIEFEQKLKAA
jgi:uncharacterized protein (DUF433 family)/DNA-binding transcriptional MerR regulator